MLSLNRRNLYADNKRKKTLKLMIIQCIILKIRKLIFMLNHLKFSAIIFLRSYFKFSINGYPFCN
jgi:hypothetical protein